MVRGNKRDKPDFEACFGTTLGGTPTLFALGSGSHPNGECVAVVIEQAGQRSARLVHLPALYAALRDHAGFLSSELNLEGAVLMGETLRLFSAATARARPVWSGPAAPPATCLSPRSWPTSPPPAQAPVPSIEQVRHYDLGRIGDARLTFTDAALRADGTLLYSASAESSPNAYDDGAVAGSALGVLSEQGARYTLLRDERGALALDKAEGLALRAGRVDQALVVFDPDDRTRPACLAEVTLRGF